ncbi:hypothetical protein [Absidia glauca]|uniref:Uncharacterized protein n=1 Tax=Absidia glauca TaxID=4829 RepID=A0A168R828_ABSGL|nr:hypothetical protein [Absidia glauca]
MFLRCAFQCGVKIVGEGLPENTVYEMFLICDALLYWFRKRRTGPKWCSMKQRTTSTPTGRGQRGSDTLYIIHVLPLSIVLAPSGTSFTKDDPLLSTGSLKTQVRLSGCRIVVVTMSMACPLTVYQLAEGTK